MLAPVLHIEGAEAIDPDFALLDVLYEAGLRSLGPVWSRSNVFGHGVPFRCPSSPDTGPGLTDLGKALVSACNRLEIMIDLSHLNEKGFGTLRRQNAPLVATHSNAHASVPAFAQPHRQQLAAIRDSGGMVGVNFATNFIRADGRRDADTPLEQVIEHIDHLLAHVGEDDVGFGSDFDGPTPSPPLIRPCRGPPRLVAAHAPAWLRRGLGPQDRLGQLARPPGVDLGRLRARRRPPALRQQGFGLRPKQAERSEAG